MKYKTSKEKNFLEPKDNNNNNHGFTTNLKRNIKTDNNKQLDNVKEKNKINKRYFKYKYLFFFNYIFLKIVFISFPKKVISQYEHYINISFKGEGYHKFLSDEYKDQKISQIFFNGEERENNITHIFVNYSTDVVTLVWENKISDFSFMFNNLINITYIYMYKMADSNCNMSYEFNNCINLKEVVLEGDVAKNIINVYNTKGMFYNCRSLNNIDLTDIGTADVKDMSYMFYKCESLNNIIIDSFENSQTLNMRGIFYNCKSLNSLNLSNFYTKNVEIMWDMFKGCSKLEYLDLSTFDTSKVKDMESMFEDCSQLRSLDISHFNTSKVQYMNKMFKNCIKLEILNFSSISVESLGTMHQMFYKCLNLKYLNIYSLIEDVQSVFEMFGEVQHNFTFCIKEDQNIPNIFKELSKGDAIRDCSSDCYGNETERISVPSKKLCCPLFEYNDECYEKCPSRTNPSEFSKRCENFTCESYYNYTQDGCIEEIPDGYYNNDSILRTIDKCHENCVKCEKGATHITTNCLECISELPYIYLGNCYSRCEKGEYNDNGIIKCRCLDEKCLLCSEESLKLDLCEKCNDNFYEIFNEPRINPDFLKCYQEPEGYFLDETIKKYKPCFKSCKYCTTLGTKKEHLCKSCNSDYSYSIPMENNLDLVNCYPKCKYNYYFDEDDNYKCLNSSGCPDNMRFLIDGTKECVSSCRETKFHLEFRKKCFKKCPIESVEDETGRYCKSLCLFEKPFELIEEQICVSKCTIMERYYKKCVTNYNGDGEDEVQDIVLENIQDDISETFDYSFITNNRTVILEDNKVFYEITSTNSITSDPRISRIDLGECEAVLKSYYEIDMNDTLYILKIDAYVEGQIGPKVEYEIYYPLNGIDLNLLDISICEGIDIFIGFPVNITKDLDLYDKNSKYYSDICYPYTNENGTDVTLKDRQNEFEENNMSLCENNCNFAGYNEKTGTAKCSCGVKLNIPMVSELKVDKNKLIKFMDIKTIANFNIMKCFSLFFSKRGITTNIGFHSFYPTIIMYFICIIFLYAKEYSIIKYQINEIVFAKRNMKYLVPGKESFFQKYLEKKGISLGINKEKKKTNENILLEKNNKINDKKEKRKLMLTDKNKKNIFTDLLENNKEENIGKAFNNIYETIPIKKYNKKINQNNCLNTNNNIKKKSELKKDDLEPFNTASNSKRFTEKQKQKIKDILQFNHTELDDMNYKNAIKYDQRTFLELYFSLLYSNHLLIKIFDKSDYNSMNIKIFLLFFNFTSCFAVNALFFSDETMHQIYEDEGDFNFIYQLPQIAYSTVISFILDNVTNFLALSQDDIIELKQDKKIKNIGNKARALLRALRLKFVSFFILSFLLILSFWYYLGCFCAIYKNTQFHLIKDTLISFGTGMLFPLLTSLLPAFFRFVSLKNKSREKKIIYWFSQLIAKYL